MIRTVDGLVCVAVGCLQIVLNKPFARGYTRFQNRLLGFDPGRHGVRRGWVVAVFVLLGISLLAFPLIGRLSRHSPTESSLSGASRTRSG